MAIEFIDPSEVAELIGLTEDQLAQLRYKGTGPKFYKPTPRKVLYRREEVLEWVAASAATRTGEPTHA